MSRYCIRGGGGALGGRGLKTNGEKFMHSLSGPRARSREFLRAASAGWVYVGVEGTRLLGRDRAVAKIAAACGIRNLAVAACEGDCA